MAQIWIQGRPVIVEDPQELLRLIQYADKDKASPELKDRDSGAKAGSPDASNSATQRPALASGLTGIYALLEPAGKGVLKVLARAYPEEVGKDDLMQRSELESERALGGALSSITKRSGRKGSAVETIMARNKEGEREYRYRLTDAMMTVAGQEGWYKRGDKTA